MIMKHYGSFVLMLHSHLPFYRKAGMWPFGEENLYDCMLETYIPLLNALNELREEGIKAGITVGLTPILTEQLADEHLQEGFIKFVKGRIAVIDEDVERYPDPKVPHSEHLSFLAGYYQQYYSKILEDFTVKYQKNLVNAFKELQDADCIEITTSGATHGFLPLLGTDESIQAQIKVGVESYKRHFGRAPKGIWLPECAYRPAQEHVDPETGKPTLRPAIEAFLFEHGIKHFFTEYHAIEGSVSSEIRRDFGVYRDIQYIPLPNRGQTGLTTHEAYWLKDYPVAVIGRNNRASFQVWSAAHGYPGDGLYREFHRKDANSGMKYWRLTSKDAELGDKMLYDPVLAQNQTKMHADHFVSLVYDILKEQYHKTGEPKLVMVSFDTELYGHWWFEGVTWLKHVIKMLHACEGVDVETSSQYLEHYPPQQAIELPESTWGQGGHYWVWNNQHTAWMWPTIHQCEVRLRKLVQKHANETDALKIEVLNQALRELLLLESSDWPFLVTTFQAKDYAVERFEKHVAFFNQLCEMIEKDQINEEQLAASKEVDNPFPDLDFRWFETTNLPAPTSYPAELQTV
ncbi:glycoside hydrolase family 57 protein [Vampirovibrio chlorellavorus]|uniref:glycoside hydrolase family 57 protein n=1 Tax=Vampirovibrio chlorellavorus TaxID=758823 RepID=UPI002FDCA00D